MLICGCEQGDYDRGLMHGQGRYTWPDGIVYEGSFVDSTVSGRGTITWPDGRLATLSPSPSSSSVLLSAFLLAVF